MEALYNTIGSNYNITRTADSAISQVLYQSVFSGPDGRYLDVGCGTGNYTMSLASKGLSITGLDPSEKMLNTARSLNSEINWILGTAESLPFENELLDGALGTLTLHHWSNINLAFKELYRVLKKKGKIVFFTSTPEQMEGYWLNHYFPQMLEKSMRQMPSFQTIESAANNAGFKMLPPEIYFIQDDLKDHFLYVGKNRPEIYFDENIRKGISSFAALSNAEEVTTGLEKLKADIATGTFPGIKAKFANNKGDYLFFRAEKA